MSFLVECYLDNALQQLIPSAEVSKIVVRTLTAFAQPVLPQIDQECLFTLTIKQWQVIDYPRVVQVRASELFHHELLQDACMLSSACYLCSKLEPHSDEIPRMILC